MYYFVDEDTLTITTRKHLYNSEALEGSITSIEPSKSCEIVVHVPTKKFTYEYYIKESVQLEEGYEMVQKLGLKGNVPKGNTYYALVPSHRLEDYVELNELEKRTNRDALQSNTKSQSKKISPDIKEVPETKNDPRVKKIDRPNRKLISEYSGVKTVD